ncbi:hypothetical protein N9A15_04785 [Candidatus Pelagibacter sp.]|nr:hypothetical protein [Candidatus Pelagibacter sp.]
MKSLVKKILTSRILIFLRNNFHLKEVNFNFKNFECTSVSDCFLWRTDNNFKTIFKFADILKLFHNINNSKVEIHFYTKDNEFIKKILFKNLNLSNEFIIDENLIGKKDYGVFYIYHFTNDQKIYESIIANRCYVGFSQNNNINSFVHGNAFAKSRNINSQKNHEKNIINTTFFKKNIYRIQKSFKNYDKVELFFSNPTSKKLNITLSNIDFSLAGGACKKLELNNQNLIEIKSNCLFLRPTIFCYNGGYFDIHHS